MKRHELAHKLGVSTAAISYALRGNGRLSAETREHLLQQIQETSYTPNANAQRLATGRSHVIALHDCRGNLFAMQLAFGIQDALQKRGYGVLLNSLKTDEQIVEWTKSDAIDGAILIGKPFDAGFLEQIASPTRACVVVDVASHGVPYVTTININHSGVEEGVRLLLENKHHRVLFLHCGNDEEMLAAAHKVAREAGITIDGGSVVKFSYDLISAETLVTSILSRSEGIRPTAFLLFDERLSLIVLRVARRLGLAVPQDLSMISCHETVEWARYTDPPLCVVAFNYQETGEVIAQAVVAHWTGTTSKFVSRSYLRDWGRSVAACPDAV